MQSMHPYEKSISNQRPEQSPPVAKDGFLTSQGRSLFASLTVKLLPEIIVRLITVYLIRKWLGYDFSLRGDSIYLGELRQ